jgi:ribose transport system substrate-binding protein
VVVAAALALGAGACSSGSSNGGTPKIAFVVAATQLNVATEMAAGFRFGASAVGGVDASVSGPPIVDPPRQVQLFQTATGTARGGVAVFQLAPQIFVPPIAAAAAKGTPLVAVDNALPPESKVNLFIGNDNHQLGTMLADLVIDKLPAGASGTVILGTTTPGVPVLDRRALGMRDEFKRRLPKVTVLGPFDTKQDPAANLAAWEGLVNATPRALAFLGTGDADGWNLAAIRRRTHGHWLAGAYDLNPRSLQAVKDGQLLLVSPEHFSKGAIAGRLLAQHAKRHTALPKGWIYTPGLAVTTGNINEIMLRQASEKGREAWFGPVVDRVVGNLKASLRPLSAAG